MLADGLGSARHADDPGSRVFLWRTGTEEEFHLDDCALVCEPCACEYPVGPDRVFSCVRAGCRGVYRQPGLSGSYRGECRCRTRHVSPARFHDVPALLCCSYYHDRHIGSCRAHQVLIVHCLLSCLAHVVYCPIAHWAWGGGWAQQMGLIDFAGGR